MNAAASVKAYANIGLETNVSGADPHKLILMLFQGALMAITIAKGQMQRKETAAKGASISKAIAIIDEGLKASLDRNAGGELANNLSALYEYMGQRLLIANLRNDTVALDEVYRLLDELKGAWEAIRPASTSSAQQQGAPAKLVHSGSQQVVSQTASYQSLAKQKILENQQPAASPLSDQQAPAKQNSMARAVALTYGRV